MKGIFPLSIFGIHVQHSNMLGTARLCRVFPSGYILYHLTYVHVGKYARLSLLLELFSLTSTSLYGKTHSILGRPCPSDRPYTP